MSSFHDDDIPEGIPLPEDEEPTRAVGQRPGEAERRRGPPGPPVEPEAPTERAVPSARRWSGRSVPSLVGSEEALRVFDELSNPDVSGVTFSGVSSGESYVETLPPAVVSTVASEGETQEISYADVLGEDSAPLAPVAPDALAAQDADLGTYQDAYLVFEHSPCPLFRLDDEGRIRLANQALCRFLSLERSQVLGQALHRTRLGQIYPELQENLDEAITTRSPLQQLLSFQDAQGNTVRFMIWVVPFPRRAGRSHSFAGIIMPVPS